MSKDISFLGIGAGFSPELENTSAYFVCNDRLIIIDCGETVFGALYNKGLLHKYPRIAVLLTHMHADHAGSLAALASYCELVLHKIVDIIHPETENVILLNKLMGVEKHEYRLHTSVPQDFGFSCDFIPVKHADNMKCYGLLINTDNWCIWYSGDAAQVPDTILSAFRAGKIQRIYQDTTQAESAYHASLSYLCETFSFEERNRVFSMHLTPQAFSVVKEEGFQIAEVAP